ncbi:Uncharacterized protein TCAP_00313 [Tolypocladium capitatum]|uniref:DUF2423 domain-containing protein n=1 Tax=Tolypocladium capitatum TaxID=45235 RepID=A0A2K3QQG8_9HYPO|nr:Uncharacterized protein TCAP_00313 [Tolypocladium capitatum]
MAKSSRSSSKKANNRRKATAVFGPAELARDERLSAKLLALAKAPKPEPSDVNMEEAPAEAKEGPVLTLALADADDVALDGENDEADAGDTGMLPRHVTVAGARLRLSWLLMRPLNLLAMQVDVKKLSTARIGKKRIDKRKQKKSKVVFTKYSDRLAAKKKKSKGTAAEGVP